MKKCVLFLRLVRVIESSLCKDVVEKRSISEVFLKLGTDELVIVQTFICPCIQV